MNPINPAVSQAADASEAIGVEIEELSARLRFHPEEGQIWLEGERMVLMHLAALSSMRRELIDRFGIATAKSIFQRLGHASGTIDAALARHAAPHASAAEGFMAGPRLHALEGMVAVEPVHDEFEPESGFHLGEWIWRNSAEVEAHLDAYGVSAEPVCWTMIGYASAYTSAFMGRPILYREVECKATGAPHCRIVGKPAEMWDDDEADLLHLAVDLDAVAEVHESAWQQIGAHESSAILWPSERLVGASPAFVSMVHQVERVAATDAPVLFYGEPGVGKKSCGRMIHKKSARAAKPIVVLNCGALKGDQLDIEMFGLEKAGALPGKQGRIERAHGGTLFLEDVHHLDLRAQTKLLRMMQMKEVERAGNGPPRPVDVRILASANENLIEKVKAGEFRADLYYRLTVIPILIPPLRERRSDIALLIRHFLSLYGKKYGQGPKAMTADAIAYLSTHEFPGNIAELEAMIERAAITSLGDAPITVSNLASPLDIHQRRFYSLDRQGRLSNTLTSAARDDDDHAIDQLLEDDFDLVRFEHHLIARAVDLADGNLSKAAKSLGLTRPQLAYRYKKGVEDGG